MQRQFPNLEDYQIFGAATPIDTGKIASSHKTFSTSVSKATLNLERLAKLTVLQTYIQQGEITEHLDDLSNACWNAVLGSEDVRFLLSKRSSLIRIPGHSTRGDRDQSRDL